MKIDNEKWKRIKQNIKNKYLDDVFFIIAILVFNFNSLWINIHFGLYVVSLSLLLLSFVVAKGKIKTKGRG